MPRAASLLLLVLTATAVAPERSPLGAWRGPLRLADGTTVEIVVDLARDEAGTVSGVADIPAQAIDDLELLEIVVDGERLAFTAPDLPGAPRFTAALAAEDGGLAGVMTALAAPAPATDIYLAQVGAGWTLSEIVNITAREGYDSQPAFLPDGSRLLYTAQHEGQTDIWGYDLARGTSRQLTATSEAEYSPTPMADGASFSSVRVEADGAQRLWSFPLAAGEPRLLLPEVAPVGYHAWIDEATVALFVLGEPATLRLARLGRSEVPTLAEDIGRCLARAPGGGFSYLDKSKPEAWRIVLRDGAGGAPRVVGEALAGSEDYVWTASGELVMGQGAKLFLGAPGEGAIAWREVADLSAAGVAGITRLALSPGGDWLAVVGETPAPPPATVEHAFAWRRVER